ncbi:MULTISPECIES: AraC family transcriptional regulator [unclassified Streptomyces]|uniref:helix-turn-helix domain-containing protein n=1 Tax=unclassified Streptomyces TaxID=2593676 RepID=UPI00224E6D0B|nr:MULTISPECIES: helix-turn-helix domain-containing protein [unclassified Streptomyces]MCX4524189.1 helix-turn-helix domain-containing protein [Streptomyces sp. NBC_01551]MCX4545292.1 helix-turn-helix domain-containing protein [Streptomyces sp. NBC_01565]
MGSIERPAPPWLRGRVVKYRGYRTQGGGPAPRLNLPAATVTLVLGWGEPLRVREPGDRGPGEAWRSVLFGLRTSPVLGGYPGVGQAIEVEFTPLGAYACLGVPMAGLADTRVAAEDVLGARWTARITERCAAARDWEGCWAILDDALGRRLGEGPPVSPVAAEAWHRLRASHGGTTLRELVTSTGRSRRRLQVLFREQIGLPPQSVTRVLRFQRALTVPPGSFRSLAELAAACGYYDQAHLARDVRALAGLTPSELGGLAERAVRSGAAVLDGRLTALPT